MRKKLPKKLYYSIGEVAKSFDVNTSLIRFWEKEFKIIQPKKNKKGNRMFTPKDVHNIEIIYHLVKERGYTLDGAQTALSQQQNIVKEVEVITRLQALKAELIELKAQFDVK